MSVSLQSPNRNGDSDTRGIWNWRLVSPILTTCGEPSSRTRVESVALPSSHVSSPQSPSHISPERLRSCQSRMSVSAHVTHPFSVRVRPSRYPRPTKLPWPSRPVESPRTPEPPYHPATSSTYHFDSAVAEGFVVRNSLAPSDWVSRAVR